MKKLLDCALIGVCVVIRLNMVFLLSIPSPAGCFEVVLPVSLFDSSSSELSEELLLLLSLLLLSDNDNNNKW